MATHRISLLSGAIPDNSGNVFIEPYTVKATNDVWGGLVTIFNDTATRLGLRGFVSVPKNYNSGGTTKIVVVWTSTATSGNVVWDADYRAVTGDDSESLDQTSNQESVTVTDAAPGAANRRLEALMTLTAGNLAAGDTLEWELFRDGANGSDTMAAAAILFDVLLEYTD
jgi:hypothetical protein